MMFRNKTENELKILDNETLDSLSVDKIVQYLKWLTIDKGYNSRHYKINEGYYIYCNYDHMTISKTGRSWESSIYYDSPILEEFRPVLLRLAKDLTNYIKEDIEAEILNKQLGDKFRLVRK